MGWTLKWIRIRRVPGINVQDDFHMSETDYYKILGVAKDASDSEIKKAYRKLAMKYHPDHAKDDKAAEERFKKISEAYAVLSDPEKRKQYDTFGADGFQQRFSQEDIFRGFDFSEILREFGFGGGGRGFKFSFGGGAPFGGGGGMGGGSPFGTAGRQRTPKGTDLMYELPLTLQEVAAGAHKTIAFEHGGKTRKIAVRIPKGLGDGKKLRLSGKGETSPYGGPPGDLYVKVRLLKDPQFEVDGADVLVNREVKLTEALLGTEVRVPTLDGTSLTMKVPPGTRHRTKMRIPGRGLPVHGENRHGDLFAIILVDIPKHLTQRQRDLVGQLAAEGL